jgi:two-component system nitrogen regulation sensor histidine kinase GlnL
MPKNKLTGKTAAGVDSPLQPADILSGLEEAVFAVDAEARVVFANPAVFKMFGVDPLRDGEEWATLLRRNPWLAEGIELACRQSRSYVRHQVDLLGYGVTLKVSARITPLFEGDGELRGAVCLFVDETSLQTLAENIRQGDRLRELGIVAAGLAHEIKNPLGGILGAAQLLRSEAVTQDAKECVELIENDVRRINRLLEGLLDFGNAKRPERVPVNLHQLIDKVIVGLEHDPVAKGHAMVRDYDPSLPEVNVAPDAIHQVLLNLVKNALEAAAPGTPVVVRTRVDIAARRISKRAVLIEVQNEGPSIQMDAKEKLFTPFYTTKPTGTGLGLLITLRIVKEHGGALDVVSERGRTTFSVALPMEI